MAATSKQTTAAPALAFPGCAVRDLASPPWVRPSLLVHSAFLVFGKAEIASEARRFMRDKARPGSFDAARFAENHSHRLRVEKDAEEVRLTLRVDDGDEGIEWAFPVRDAVELLLGPARDNPEAQLVARLEAEANAREAARREVEALAAHRRDQAEREAEHARQRERWAGLDRFTRAAIKSWHQVNALPESARADVSPIALLAALVRRLQIEPERVPDRENPPCRLETVLGWPASDSIEVDRPRDSFDAEEARWRERVEVSCPEPAGHEIPTRREVQEAQRPSKGGEQS